MAQTKQYAKYGTKLGKPFYVAQPYRYIFSADGECIEDQENADSRTFPNAGLAKAWLRKRLPELGEGWKGQIERGAYEDCSFHDTHYGHGFVRDVTWETDWEFVIDAWQDDEGVEFDD